MPPSAVYVPPPPALSEQQQQQQQQHATMTTVPGGESPLLFDFDDPIIFAPFTSEMEEEEEEEKEEKDAEDTEPSHLVKEQQQQQRPPPRPRTPELELNFSFSDDDDFDVVEIQARLRAGLPAYGERQLDLSGPDWSGKPSKPTILKDPTAPPQPPPLPASKSKLLDNADPSRPPKAATSGPKKGPFTSLKSSTSTTSAPKTSTSHHAGSRPVFGRGKHTKIASSSSSKPIRAPIPRSVQEYLKNLVPDDQPKATSFSKRIDPKTVVGQNQPNSSVRERPRTRPPPPPVRPDIPLEPLPNVPTILPPLYQIKNTGLRPSEKRLREEVKEELNRGSKAAEPSKVATKKESKKGGGSKSKAGKMTKPAEDGTITQAFAGAAAAAFKYPWDRANEPEVVKKTIVLEDGKVADVTMKIRNDATGAGSLNPPGPETVPKEKRHKASASKTPSSAGSSAIPGPSHPTTQPKPSTSKAPKPEPEPTFIPDKFAYKGDIAIDQLRIDTMIKDRQLALERPQAELMFREEIPEELFWYPRAVEEEEEVPEEVLEVQDGQLDDQLLVVHVDGQQQDQLENQAVVRPEDQNQLEVGLAEGRHEDQQVNQVEVDHRPQTPQNRHHPKVEVIVLSSQTDIEDLGEDDLNWDDDDLNLNYDDHQQQQQYEEEDDDDADSSFTFELEPGSEDKYRGGRRDRSSRADSTDSEDLDEQARSFKRRTSIDLCEFKKRPTW